jgi:V8-like Glu-specific endopeptidase
MDKRFFWAIFICLLIVPYTVQSADSGSVRIVGATVNTAALDPNYWTAERMQSAIPYPVRLTGRPIAGLPARADGPAGGEDGGLPKGRKVPALQSFIEPYSATVNAQGYAYPYPFTRYQNFDGYDVWPYSTVVKIYFSDGGKNFVCSGAVWPNRSVLTAGHCIYNPDAKRFHSHFIVIPQYKNGEQPLGSWGASEVFTTDAWQKGDFSYDFGLIVTEKQAGRNISYYTGYLGAQWNASLNQSWTVIGYPAARPFNGKVQQICIGSYAESDTTNSPAAVAIGCDLTGGSSGGPWIVSFRGTGGGNRINGLMSYGYASRKKASYSPYFGSTAKQFWDIARRKK